MNLVAQDWAETAARKKGLAVDAAAAGEEWFTGPYAVITYCNALMETLAKVAGNKHLDGLPMRELAQRPTCGARLCRIPCGTGCC